MIATFAWIGTANSSTTYTYQPTVTKTTAEHSIIYLYSTDYLKDYVGEVSIKYGLTPTQYQEMMAVIQAESGFQIYPKPNGVSWGIAQFIPSTFKLNCKGDLMNPVGQIDCMTKMWSKHQEAQWDEYCLLFAYNSVDCKKRGL